MPISRISGPGATPRGDSCGASTISTMHRSCPTCSTVRLATSARLAPAQQIQQIRYRDMAEAVLRGYRAGLVGPRPTLLDEHETWMRAFVACSDRDREAFWAEIADLPSAEPPAAVATGLRESLPADASIVRFTSRV